MLSAAITRLRATTAYLAIAAGLVSFSSLEFMLVEVQSEFALSADATIVVAQIAAGACLFAVFLSGALADRLGERRMLEWAGLLFCVGAVLVGVAPHVTLLVLGLSIAGVGTIVLSIVGLAVLRATFPDPGRRARAFGGFAVVAPVVSIVTPLVASVVISHTNWRLVPVL